MTLLALAAVSASHALAADSSSDGSLAMSVGTKGDTVESESGTTVFLGTEYNPSKCVLQFLSLECETKGSTDICGELNGYALTCNNKGRQDGKNKMMCECDGVDASECQTTASPNATGTVPQFGDCSNNQQCVDSYGYITTSTEEGPICAEKLHCVEEVNTTATEPASICHTCMSCIAQNAAADNALAGVKRFNCTAICPEEVLDTIAERNAAGVGIADAVPSAEASGSVDSNATNSSSASGSSAAASGSGSNAAPSLPRWSAASVVSAVSAVALALAMVN